MSHALSASLLSLGLLAGMLILLEVGRRAGVRTIARSPGQGLGGVEAIETAVLALFGLFLAFTFSGAGARFDGRRDLIVEEANAIGTAYLRVDVLPAAAQPALREHFRRYVDARLEIFRKLPDMAAARRELATANGLRGEIWRLAIAGVQTEGAPPHAPVVLLPALNAMIDITTTQTMAAQMHPPVAVFVLLFTVALASALLAGYRMAASDSRSWLHMLCFASVIAVTVYVILDLEFPRLGLIRVAAFDQALVDLRETMK